MADEIPGACESMDINSTDVPLVDCIEFSQMSNDIEFIFLDQADGKLKRVKLGCLVQSIESGGNRKTYRNYAEASSDNVSPGDEWLLAKDNDLGMPEGLVIVQPVGYQS